MKCLSVYLEIQGEQKHVGDITGTSYLDASFCYSEDYLDASYATPISVSLPLSESPFSPERTKCFFEGLLPEGFSRKAVSNWIKTDEADYITILSVLGRECLGAIKIVEDDHDAGEDGYELLSMARVKELAGEGATKATQILMETHLSLAGATGKVGLFYDEEKGNWYLPKGNASSTHIVKQSHVRLSQIVLNEQLCMLTAKGIGIDVPESFIINTGKGADDEILFAIRRFDRTNGSGRFYNNLQIPLRLHQEDMAQAMGIPASEKYEREPASYLRRMFDVIRENAVDPINEQRRLWKRICFQFLIGNTDCHIKNLSLLYSEDLKRITLSPAYDIVCTKLYNLTNQMSFFLGGEIDMDKMNRSTFGKASEEVGLTERMALSIFDEVADHFEKALDGAASELCESGFSEAVAMKDKILTCGGYGKI